MFLLVYTLDVYIFQDIAHNDYISCSSMCDFAGDVHLLCVHSFNGFMRREKHVRHRSLVSNPTLYRPPIGCGGRRTIPLPLFHIYRWSPTKSMYIHYCNCSGKKKILFCNATLHCIKFGNVYKSYIIMCILCKHYIIYIIIFLVIIYDLI